MLSRFVNFFHGLRSSASHEVRILARLLARDVQSVTGKNLNLIKELTKLNPWNTPIAQIKVAMYNEEAVKVPELDGWRLPYLVTLLKNRGEAFYRGDEELEMTYSVLIDSLVIN